MRNRSMLRIVAAWLLLVCTAAVAAMAEGDKGVHLLVYSGQSNMVGLPDKSATALVAAAFLGQEIIPVKVASGGKPILPWVVPREGSAESKKKHGKFQAGHFYLELMKAVRAAMGEKKPTTITFLWMQGERDGKSGTAPEVYGENLKTVVQQLREDLDFEDINVVVGRINDALVGQAG